MRDLVFSLLIGGSVVIGTTEVIGVTNVLEGQNPGEVMRAAVPDLPPDFPNSLIPGKARSMFANETPPVADPLSSPGADSRPMYIARTGGTGVRARLACGDGAPGQGVIPEGTQVTVVRQGGADCPGWAVVNSGAFDFWVRTQYLDASPPKPTAKPAEGAKGAERKDSKDSNDSKDERRNEGSGRKDDAGDDGKRKGEPTPAPTASPAPAPTEPPATATATATASATPEPTSFPSPKRPPKVPTRDEPRDEES